MPDFTAAAYLLLPVAAAAGWYAARRRPSPTATADPRLSADYLRGLNYLVNDDADKAIEVFVRMVEVDHETVEIHFALGNLFRRQGEVDRALRIHQNLVARPNLSPEHRNQARFELARDYQRAGMLDRAEELFQDLAAQGSFQDPALAGLIAIYEQERDWQKAIDTTRRLESVRGSSLRPIIAQYLCELAAGEQQRRDLRAASQLLRQAQSEFRDCVRASLMQGEIEEAAGAHEAAARHYRRVVDQDLDYVGEILEPLERCYERGGRADAWQTFLEETAQRHDGAAVRIAMARLLMKQGKEQAAIDYLSRELQTRPSWVGFHHLLEISQSQMTGSLDSSMAQLRVALQRVIQASPRYQCAHCGFSGRTLYWQCPGCRQWNSVIPLADVIVKAA
jgi:lipopolysaccharide biosynthesis regulator YciM